MTNPLDRHSQAAGLLQNLKSLIDEPGSANSGELTQAQKFKLAQERAVAKKLEIQELLDSSLDLDSTLNFRVNAKLKAEFERLCKLEHSSVSREIKLFMSAVVRAQSIKNQY